MDIPGYFKKGVAMARLKGEAADEVAADPDSFIPAIVIFAVPLLVTGISDALLVQQRMGLNTGGLVLMVTAAVMVSFLGPLFAVGILHQIARLFKGEGKYLDCYQTMGIGSLPSWGLLLPLPYVGLLFGLWQIPVFVVVASKVHKLGMRKSAAVVLIPFSIVILIGMASVVFPEAVSSLYMAAGKLAYRFRN